MNISNVEMMMRNNIQPLKKIIGIFLFFLSIILFIVFIGLIIQGPDVFNSLNSSIIDQKIDYIYFFFMSLPFAFRLPFSISTEIAFIFLLIFYSFMICLTFFGSKKNILNLSEDLWRGKINSLNDNAFTSTIIVTFSTLILVSLITSFQNQIGVETGEIIIEKSIDYLWITYAPLIEEIGFRLSFIGIIPSIVLFSRLRKKKIKISIKTRILTIFYPMILNEIAVTELDKDHVKKWIWGMVIFSSLIFGLTHFLLGDVWGLGKITSAFIAGISMGYLYVKHGFPAAVFSHWIFNYGISTLDMTYEAYPWMMVFTFFSMFIITLIFLISKKNLVFNYIINNLISGVYNER